MKKNEIESMNSELSEFDLQALETRLETDPLAAGGLLNLSNVDDTSLLDVDSSECTEHCSGLLTCNIK